MSTLYAKDAHQAAVDYRERGWSPIRLKGKIPAEPWAEYQERRMPLEEIEAKPWPGVGIVTGAISDLAVLDFDSPEAEVELTRRGHPATPMAKTARGMHAYFQHPGGELPTRIGLGSGLDLKGDGGYVVAPPSKHPSGAVYEWIISPEDAEPAELPAWVMEQVRLRARRASRDDLGGEEIPNGSRNERLTSIGGTLRRRGLDEAAISAALLGINTAKCKLPLPDAEVEGIAASVARYEPSSNGDSGTIRPAGRDDPTFNLTDLGNAQRLAADHGGNVRYCYAWGKWLVWDGKRWIIDNTGEVERLMKDSVRRIYTDAAAEEHDKARKALADHAKRSESKARITDALYLARSEPGVPVSPDQLDADVWAFNTLNGTLDLKTGELREHSREDLITKIVPAEYDPGAEAPTWQAALERWLPSGALRRFVQRVAGYALTGDVSEQVLPFLCGPGANGKTTFINTLLATAGDYGQQAAPDLLLAKRGGHPTEVADLFGARLVASVEVEDGRRLAESLVKQLTGGDRIKARRMREDFWEFDPTHKAVLVANHKPVVRGTEHAIWRRIKLVPFEAVIPKAEQDPRLLEKLRVEMPGILAWAVRGCLEWQREGLGEPEEVLAATQQYREEMDVLAGFLDDRCVVHPRAEAPATPLYNEYQEWCRSNGEAEENQRRFGGRLRDRGFDSFDITSGAHKGRKGWRGVGLKTDNPDGGRSEERSTPVDDQSGTTGRNEAQDAYKAPDTASEGLPGRGTASEGLPGENRIGKPSQPDAASSGRPSRPKNGINELKRVHEAVIPKEGLPSSTSSTASGGPAGWFGASGKPERRYQDASELLADPPAWFVAQLERCRAKPDSLLKPTAVAISSEVYGSAERWREVLPVLDAHVGPDPRQRGKGGPS